MKGESLFMIRCCIFDADGTLLVTWNLLDTNSDIGTA